MSDDTIDEGGYVSPPIRVAVTSGYRVGRIGTDTVLSVCGVIENASDRTIAFAIGDTDEQANEMAKMIVACLNRVPQ